MDAVGGVPDVRDHLHLDVHGVVPEIQAVVDRVHGDRVAIGGDVIRGGPLHVHLLELVFDEEIGLVVVGQAARVHHDHAESVIHVPVPRANDLGAIPVGVEVHALGHAVESLESVLGTAQVPEDAAKQQAEEENARAQVGHVSSPLL